MKEKNKNISNYTATDIRNYIEGKLSAEQMHALEKAALQDPFLADALQGYMDAAKRYGKTATRESVLDLQKRLAERVRDKKEKKFFAAPSRWWQVAAAVILLAGTSIVFYRMSTKTLQKEHIAQTKKPENGDQLSRQTNPDSGLSRPDISVISPQVKKYPKTVRKLATPKISKQAKAQAKKTVLNKKSDHENGDNEAVSRSRIAPDQNKFPGASRDSAQGQKPFLQGTGVGHLRPAEATAQAQALNQQKKLSGYMVTGKVLDAERHPVIGATITPKNEEEQTVTDNNGFFRIFEKKRDSALEVTVHSVGFETTNATLQQENDLALNTISLKSNRSSLNEIIMTGFATRKKNTLKELAGASTLNHVTPVGGWEKYIDYINHYKGRKPDSSGVKIIEVISFVIRSNGLPRHFRIEQSYSDEYDTEAIRLIKNGAPWKLLGGKKTRVVLTIEF